MVIIGFELTDSIIDKHKGIQFDKENESFILLTYFFTPIRMKINDLELFEGIPIDEEKVIKQWEKKLKKRYLGNQKEISDNLKKLKKRFFDNKTIISPWVEMPLIGFTIDTYSAIKQACSGKPKRLFLHDIGGYLDLLPTSDNRIEIFSSENKLSTFIECEELIKEFSNFDYQVIKRLNEKIPEIKKNPYIKQWMDS